jgi:hypothetical protein
MLMHYRTKISNTKNETHEMRLDWLEQDCREVGVQKERRGAARRGAVRRGEETRREERRGEERMAMDSNGAMDNYVAIHNKGSRLECCRAVAQG